jgi:hypothetical protein
MEQILAWGHGMRELGMRNLDTISIRTCAGLIGISNVATLIRRLFLRVILSTRSIVKGQASRRRDHIRRRSMGIESV